MRWQPLYFRRHRRAIAPPDADEQVELINARCRLIRRGLLPADAKIRIVWAKDEPGALGFASDLMRAGGLNGIFRHAPTWVLDAALWYLVVPLLLGPDFTGDGETRQMEERARCPEMKAMMDWARYHGVRVSLEP